MVQLYLTKIKVYTFKSEEDIVSAISGAYSIEIDVAKQDVKDFIQSLKKGGI